MKRLLHVLLTAACFAEVRESFLSQKAQCGAPSMTCSLVMATKSRSVFQQLSVAAAEETELYLCCP